MKATTSVFNECEDLTSNKIYNPLLVKLDTYSKTSNACGAKWRGNTGKLPCGPARWSCMVGGWGGVRNSPELMCECCQLGRLRQALVARFC